MTLNGCFHFTETTVHYHSYFYVWNSCEKAAEKGRLHHVAQIKAPIVGSLGGNNAWTI